MNAYYKKCLAAEMILEKMDRFVFMQPLLLRGLYFDRCGIGAVAKPQNRRQDKQCFKRQDRR